MAQDPLSTPFDLLVCGTSLINSIVAAAACVAGKRVLHVDANPFYGSADATLPLPQLLPLLSSGCSFSGAALRGLSPPEPLPPSASSVARHVMVDLAPRVLLAQGALPSLLVASDAARYLTFRRVERCFVGCGGDAAPLRVPASKADVFLDGALGLLEKRAVMRFLQAATDGVAWAGEAGGVEEGAAGGSGDAGGVAQLNEAALGAARSLLRPQNKAPSPVDEAAFAGAPFAALLGAMGLSPRAAAMVRCALALEGCGGPPWGALSGAAGMARARAYLAALARFGGSAFLSFEYGAGTLCEAFCRLAAVHGGIYMLGDAPGAWREEEEEGSGGGEEEKAGGGGGAAPLRAPLLRAVLPQHGEVRTRAALIARACGPPTPCSLVVCFALLRAGGPWEGTEGGAEEPPTDAAGAPPPPPPIGSLHVALPPDPPARPFAGAALLLGYGSRAAPPGWATLAVHALVAGGEEEERAAGALLLEEARRIATWGGGRGEPPLRLLWHVEYALSGAGGGGGSPAPPPLPANVFEAPPAFEGGGDLWGGCTVVGEDAAGAAERLFRAIFPAAPFFAPPASAAAAAGGGGEGGARAAEPSGEATVGTAEGAAAAPPQPHAELDLSQALAMLREETLLDLF